MERLDDLRLAADLTGFAAWGGTRPTDLACGRASHILFILFILSIFFCFLSPYSSNRHYLPKRTEARAPFAPRGPGPWCEALRCCLSGRNARRQRRVTSAATGFGGVRRVGHAAYRFGARARPTSCFIMSSCLFLCVFGSPQAGPN